MADKNSPPLGLTRKSFFCLFSVTSILFILSWFFVLRSTGGPHFIDHSLLPNSKLFSMMDNSNFKTRNHSVAETLPLNEQALVGDEEETPITTRATGSDPKESGTGTSSQRCKYSKAFIKVFMYDLPSEFHFGLLGWKPEGNSVWPDLRSKVPDYPGALNLQHSIEYWLTLDLLASKFDNSPNSRSAILVHNSTEADVIFVPFFSSLSYNRYSKVRPHQKKSNNNLLQEKLVKFVTEQEEWKRSGGRDHIVMAHHPNSLLYARKVLWPTMFILSDFGRYPPTLANVEKDIIAPYKHIIGNYYNDTSNYDSRPTLLYFQGAIYRKDGGFIRQELFYMLKDEEDVHFSFGSVQKDGISKATEGMRSSKFCLNIAGDTPSSNRLFDAIASHCVPVIISDEIELPFEDVLDYSEFCLFVRTSDALKSKFLISLIRSIGREEWTRMWRRLKEVENFFEFKYPSTEGDAVQMIWQAVTRKVPRIKLKLHKSWRFSRSRVRRERGLQWVPSPKNFS